MRSSGVDEAIQSLPRYVKLLLMHHTHLHNDQWICHTSRSLTVSHAHVIDEAIRSPRREGEGEGERQREREREERERERESDMILSV